MLKTLLSNGFNLLACNHAEAILEHEFTSETSELISAIQSFQMPVTELIASGGGEAASTQRLRNQLVDLGWLKHNFVVQTTIDGVEKESITHEIDHVRRGNAGVVALEIEWNNKDPFFDRDLENFQRLHAQSAISVGIIITRGNSLQNAMLSLVTDYLITENITTEDPLIALGMKDRTVRQREAVEKSIKRGESFANAFARQFINDKFGMATTHWSKLEDRVARGVGNPCPLLLIGLPESVVVR